MSQQSDTSLSHRESTTYLPAIRSDSSSSGALLEARPALKAQLIEHTFVDQKKLIQKLRTRYGKDAEGNDNFRVQVGTYFVCTARA
jgi:hypothetical protein